MARAPTEEGFVGHGGTYGYRTGRTGAANQFHAGWDFRGGPGTPVYAAAPGIVETIATNDGQVSSQLRPVPAARAFDGYGNVVVVRQDDGTWASYNHLGAIKGLAPGKRLTEGALIGTIGSTTNGKFLGMGSHLHFELRRAKADGSSPFPGPYATYGIDPAEWYARYGRARHGAVLSGLSGMMLSATIPPANAEYEPPPSVWWLGPLFKKDAPWWTKALGFGAGALVSGFVVRWMVR